MTKKELSELSLPAQLVYRRVERGQIILTDVIIHMHKNEKPLLTTVTWFNKNKMHVTDMYYAGFTVAASMLAVPDSGLHRKWLQEVVVQQERLDAEEAELERVRAVVNTYNDQLVAANVPLRFLYPYSRAQAMDLRLDAITEAEATEIMAKLLRR